MIEVPAAVLIAESLAREADFFSLGTNDLTQGMLAVDRGQRECQRPLRSASLRRSCARSDWSAMRRSKSGTPINVCGEMASNPAQVVAHLGMGIDRSRAMTPSAIPTIRTTRPLHRYRNRPAGSAEEILTLSTPREAHDFLHRSIGPLLH
jgi:phosphoenolpyruvate-protein kinase (PTS system EI component)